MNKRSRPPPAPHDATATPSSSSPSSSPVAKEEARQLDADTPTTTPSGATFEAPKGWWLTKPSSKDDVLTLGAPEKDITVFLVESREADATKAIEAAWKRAQPSFARKPKETTKPPPRDGWDEVVEIIYETTAAESRDISALFRRKGTVSYVALIDGTGAGFDRRGAQLFTAIESFRAPGVEEESFAGKKPNRLDDDRLGAFMAFIEEARVKAKIPGASVAVLQDRKILVEKGMGFRSIRNKNELVGTNTLFMIGSITKPLTSLMMAKLVDEGKFGWDTAVIDVSPGFSLGDPEGTKKLAMRHTVCACTGLPRQDMTFFFGYAKTTPESRVEEMKTLKPTTAFGETFQYSNLMVSAGGYIAAKKANPAMPYGQAYDEAMRTRVLEPIGMKSSTFDFAVAEKREHANPHGYSFSLPRAPISMPLGTEKWIPAVRPAGGLWSSADDMARWVAVELNEGKTIEGKQIVTSQNLLERRKPMVRMGEKLSYGLALAVGRQAGVETAGHGGGTFGFNTLAVFLPEHGIGLVLLTNSGDAGAFLNAASRRLLEILFDGKDEAKQTFEFALERRDEAIAKETAKVDKAPSKEWAQRLEGAYTNPILGRVVVRWEKDRAVLDAGDWKAPIGLMKEDERQRQARPARAAVDRLRLPRKG
jgi:CubicO group peptidase (beta-lactamase class C family)